MGTNLGAEALASRVTLDGANRKLPGGYATGAFTLDQQVFDSISSGYLSLFGGAATLQSCTLIPADYIVSAAFMNLDVQPGTAAATISIGTSAAAGSILSAYSIATNQPVGWLDLTTNAAFTGAAQFGIGGNQGDIIAFSTNGNATATGKAIWGCLVTLR